MMVFSYINLRRWPTYPWCTVCLFFCCRYLIFKVSPRIYFNRRDGYEKKSLPFSQKKKKNTYGNVWTFRFLWISIFDFNGINENIRRVFPFPLKFYFNSQT